MRRIYDAAVESISDPNARRTERGAAVVSLVKLTGTPREGPVESRGKETHLSLHSPSAISTPHPSPASRTTF